MEAIDSYTAAFELMSEVDREQNLRELALAVGPLAAVAARSPAVPPLTRWRRPPASFAMMNVCS